MNNIFECLNTKQIDAINANDEYIRVIGAPGSGKTKTLIARYANLVLNCSVLPSNILTFTYSNKTAQEIKKELRKIFGDDFDTPVHTYLEFCARFLYNEINYLNFPKNFEIINQKEKEIVFKEICKKPNLDSIAISFEEMSELISSYKLNNINTYCSYLKSKDKVSLEKCNEYVIEYLDFQRKNKKVDFDDLICFTLYIFNNRPEIEQKYISKYKYVLADEFHEISDNEFTLLNRFVKKSNNLFVVGNSDEENYSFKRTKSYLKDFKSFYNDCRLIELNVNYRTTKEIANCFNSLISKNDNRLDLELECKKESTIKPKFFYAKNQKEEASWIVDEIIRLEEENVNLHDIAIICRTDWRHYNLERGLINKKIPYKFCGLTSFYDKKEIKNLLNLLNFVINKDDYAFKKIYNVPARKFLKEKFDFLCKLQQANDKTLYENLKDNIGSELFNIEIKNFVNVYDMVEKFGNEMSVHDIVKYLYVNLGYKKQIYDKNDKEVIKNVNKFLALLENNEKISKEKNTVAQYLQKVALLNVSDDKTEENKVQLMTASTSKGLSFKYVFIYSLNEKNWPSSTATNKQRIQEERQLLYVAMTCAIDRLYLSAPAEIYGEGIVLPSRFLFDIDIYSIEWTGENIQDKNYYKLKSKDANSEDQSLFEVNTCIRSKLYGIGKIIYLNQNTRCYGINFIKKKTSQEVPFFSKTLESITIEEYAEAAIEENFKNIENSKKEESLSYYLDHFKDDDEDQQKDVANNFSNKSNVEVEKSYNSNYYLSITDASQRCGVSKYFIKKYLDSGEVRNYWKGNRHYVSVHDILSCKEKEENDKNMKFAIKMILSFGSFIITLIIMLVVVLR